MEGERDDLHFDFGSDGRVCLTAKGVNDMHIDFRMLAGLLMSWIPWTKANGERTASLSKLAASLQNVHCLPIKRPS